MNFDEIFRSWVQAVLMFRWFGFDLAAFIQFKQIKASLNATIWLSVLHNVMKVELRLETGVYGLLVVFFYLWILTILQFYYAFPNIIIQPQLSAKPAFGYSIFKLNYQIRCELKLLIQFYFIFLDHFVPNWMLTFPSMLQVYVHLLTSKDYRKYAFYLLELFLRHNVVAGPKVSPEYIVYLLVAQNLYTRSSLSH
jgi:hypothetical protein